MDDLDSMEKMTRGWKGGKKKAQETRLSYNPVHTVHLKTTLGLVSVWVCRTRVL